MTKLVPGLLLTLTRQACFLEVALLLVPKHLPELLVDQLPHLAAIF